MPVGSKMLNISYLIQITIIHKSKTFFQKF